MAGDWRPEGPVLPVEFSRIAGDGRLTLIVDRRHGVECGTWACDSPLERRDAVHDLARREGCDPRWIGWVDRGVARRGESGPGFVAERVRKWCAERGYRGALWTALPSTFEDRLARSFSVGAALLYLDSLVGPDRERAFEYIRRAPASTATPLRHAFEARWPGSA